jgi:Calx-beta domain
MRIPSPWFVSLLMPLALACEEDESVVGFDTTARIGQEGDGIQEVSINLGKKVTSSVTINFIVGGSASLDGDYKVLSNTNYSLTAMSLVVKEGESEGLLRFQLIDDSQYEDKNEFILFEITGISDSELNASLRHTQFTFEIKDNDTPRIDALQVDLSWTVGEGISIDAVNFDLYLAREVVISNEEITNYELVEGFSSTNKKGFESLVIDSQTADETYYVFIRFVEGTMNADVYLHLSQGTNHGFAYGKVTTNYIGKDVYYGPITKSGDRFSFR